jgi:hypothetical protein
VIEKTCSRFLEHGKVEFLPPEAGPDIKNSTVEGNKNKIEDLIFYLFTCGLFSNEESNSDYKILPSMSPSFATEHYEISIAQYV